MSEDPKKDPTTPDSTSLPFDREALYDSEISPLMVEIIRICKENDLDMVASFHYGREADGEDHLCTTKILSARSCKTLRAVAGVIANGVREDQRVIIHPPDVMAFTIMNAGGK